MQGLQVLDCRGIALHFFAHSGNLGIASRVIRQRLVE